MTSQPRQITHSIAMVRPVAFHFNQQTAKNDFFQQKLKENPQDIEAKALLEFDGFVEVLRSKGVGVNGFQDDDSI